MDINDFIPTVEKKKRIPRSRYMKPDSVKQLENDFLKWKYRDSSIPQQCRFKRSFRDDTANGLAGCIEAWAKINGAFYQRQNSQGQYDSRLKMWRKSGTTKGIADVQVTCKGKTYNLEIKIGKDQQSNVQKDVEARIKAAGGHYAVVKCFDDFLNEMEE